MTDPHDTERLRKLDERIAALKGTQDTAPKVEEHYSQAHIGWRMVTELVSGLLIGFGIGYGLDVFFETLPIFTVVFIFLGFAAGVRVMLSTARELQTQHTPGPTGEDKGD
ncbi:MAG: ATP synthase protein I [Paracoccaceae bacterium]|jgi:ATP synthase protein I